MKSLTVAVCCLVLCVSVSAQTLTTGLVSHWKLNSVSGITWTDSTGLNDLYSVGTPNVSAGKIGNALQCAWKPTSAFPDIGSWIESTTTSNLSPGTGAFSIAMWVNLSDLDHWYNFVTKADSDSNEYSVLLADSSGIVEFWLYNSIDGFGGVDSTVIVSPGTWHFIVATYDGAVCSLYVDANTPDTAEWLTGCDVTDSVFAIGGPYSCDDILNGAIDSVSFWNRALSSSEVTQLWNEGAGLDYPFD